MTHRTTGRGRLHMGCGEPLYSRWRIRLEGRAGADAASLGAAERKAKRTVRLRRKPRCMH